MKTNRIIIIFVCVVLAFFTLGATDVIHMANAVTGEGNAEGRMIGVFVTTQPLDLFDIEGYFNDNAEKILSDGEIGESIIEKYQDRLYATLVEKSYTNEETGETKVIQEYVFEGVEGISYFSALYTDDVSTYRGSSGDDAISDGKVAISSTDEGESVSLEGTIYASTTGGPNAFYYNPVYQTAQGEVYVMTGQGMSYGGEITDGMSGYYELKQETSTTSDNESETISSYVKIGVSFMAAPKSVKLIQLDGESNVLSREEYAPGKLPDSLTVEPNTEYIVVETSSGGTGFSETIVRELYQPGDESLFAFYCRDDGILIKQHCSIGWKD